MNFINQEKPRTRAISPAGVKKIKKLNHRSFHFGPAQGPVPHRAGGELPRTDSRGITTQYGKLTALQIFYYERSHSVLHSWGKYGLKKRHELKCLFSASRQRRRRDFCPSYELSPGSGGARADPSQGRSTRQRPNPKEKGRK